MKVMTVQFKQGQTKVQEQGPCCLPKGGLDLKIEYRKHLRQQVTTVLCTCHTHFAIETLCILPLAIICFSDIESLLNSNWCLVLRRVPFASKSYLTHGLGQES